MSGGLILERRSRKDFDFDRSFFGFAAPMEEPKPLGRIEEIMDSPLKGHIVYQGDIPSCVTASFTWINQYFTWREMGEGVTLSWPYLFKISNPSPNGTKPRIVADNIRKRGQPPSSSYSLRDYLEYKEPDDIDNAGAERYRIENFSFLTDKSPQAIYRAVKQSPVVVGVGINPADWIAGSKVSQHNPPTFNHAVVVVDFDEEGNYIIINWWKPDEIDVWKLDKFYPILLAISCEDLPDGTAPVRTGLWKSLRMGFCNKI